jgi:hypothetical protein
MAKNCSFFDTYRLTDILTDTHHSGISGDQRARVIRLILRVKNRLLNLWNHAYRALINSKMEIMVLARGQNLENRVSGRTLQPFTGLIH